MAASTAPFPPRLKDCAIYAFAITKSDSTILAPCLVYVGVTGDVAVVTYGGNTVTFTAVPAGTILPVAVTQVLSTGTTATNMTGMW